MPCPEETIIYDRTGKVELARFGDAKREIVDLRRDPAGPARRDDRGRGQDVLGERRLRPGGDRLRGARLAPRAAAAAHRRSPSSSSARACSTPTLVQDPHRTAERKLKEIIQSIRRDPALPRRDGQAGIITAYLNQNYYGNQSYGVKAAVRSLLRDRHLQDHPAQAAIIAGAAQVALELRPRPQRQSRSASRPVAEGDDCRRKRQLVVPRRRHDRPAPQPDPRPAGRTAGRRCPATSTARPSSCRRGRAGRPRAARPTPRWIAPHFVWAVRDELATKLCGADADLRRARSRRAAGHDDPRRRPPEDRREVGPGRGHRAAPARTRRRPPRRSASSRRAVDGEPREQGPAQRRAGRGRLPDRRAGRLRRERGLLREHRASRSSSRSTTSSARAIASRVRRSSRSTTRSASTTRSSRPARC